MRGDKLNFYGKFFTAENFKMAFRPSGRTIPIYLAAFGSKMTRLAGRMTDGVLINMANPIETGELPKRLSAVLKRRVRSFEDRDHLQNPLCYRAEPPGGT